MGGMKRSASAGSASSSMELRHLQEVALVGPCDFQVTCITPEVRGGSARRSEVQVVLTLRAASPEEARFWVGSLLWLGRLSSKRPQLPLREVSAVNLTLTLALAPTLTLT